MSGIRRSKRKVSTDIFLKKRRKRISYAESSTTDTEEEEDVSLNQNHKTVRKNLGRVNRLKVKEEADSTSSESSNSETETKSLNSEYSSGKSVSPQSNKSTDSSSDIAVSRRQPRKVRDKRKGRKDLHKKKNDRQSKGRKDIHHILKDEDLQDETRKAEKEERERLERLKKKDDLNKSDILEQENHINAVEVVLQKEPYVEVSRYFTSKLRPHQIEGIRFIWDNLIEGTDRAKTATGGGCILAHCMGLGKTLQTIAAVHTILKSTHLDFKTVLVVAPMNTVRNWIEEFVTWCEDGDEILLYNFAVTRTNKERMQMLKSWKSDGGALIIGYDIYRRMTTKLSYRGYRKVVSETLIDPGPDLVVCDEGHMLKNSESHIAKQLNKVRSRRRLILTGTPLQNNLIEYHCMVNFVKPGLLGSLKEFRNRFVNPISNGQHTDSTERDVKVMKRRSHVLHQMLEGFVQRKDYRCLKPYLKPKYEYVVKVRLTPMQIKLYRHYLDTMTNRGANARVLNNYGRGSSLFSDYQNLMRVWTHPKCLLMHTEQQEKILLQKEENEFVTGDESESDDDWKASDKEGKKKPEIENLQETILTAQPIRLSDTSDTDEEELSKRRARKNKQKTPAIVLTSDSEPTKDQTDNDDSTSSEEEDVEKIPHLRSRRNNSNKRNRYRLRCVPGADDSSEEDLLEDATPEPKKEEWYDKILQEDSQSTEDYQNSLKVVLLFEILRMAEEKKEKVLVFSQSLTSLDLIEHMLRHAPAPSIEGDEGNSQNSIAPNSEEIEEDSESQIRSTRWYKNVDYFRMDGSTHGHFRQKWINAFNDESDTRSRLFLISTKAGGLGVNLVGANRVVIFDACWNPSHDTQSMFRVYRFGQTKICYIYRFIAEGTMEEKIYQRQVNKQSLAFRVVDEQQINRHFTASSLAELYTFQPTVIDSNNPAPLPAVPKDDILAEILSDPSSRHMIASFHEHDSLLDHQIDQELTEEERKSAWEEYELAKSGRYQANSRYPPGHPMSHGGPTTSTGSSGSFNFSFQNMQPIDIDGFRLAGLNKMMMRAYGLYQKSCVNTVTAIFRRLKQTPMYKSSDDALVRAIATEVNLRQQQQRQERSQQFHQLRMEYLKVQAECFQSAGGPMANPLGASLLASQFLNSAGRQFPSTSFNKSPELHGNSVEQQSMTSITEVIDITDDDSNEKP